MQQEERTENSGAVSSQSAELFHLIVENIKEYAIFMTDADGRIVSWNLGVERLLGYTESEIVGQPITVIFTPEDAANNAHLKEMETAARVGRAEDKRWHLRRDRSRFWANGMVMPLRNDDGSLRGFAKVMRDDTAQKLGEESVQQSYQNVEKILESINDGFYALDREWRFTYINQQSEPLLKRRRSELLGKNVWEEFPEAVGTAIHQRYQQAADEQATVIFEEFYTPLDTWFEFRVYPSPAGLAVYFHNITTRKRREMNLAFLADLQRDLARFQTADEIMRTAGEQISAYLNLSHCLFVEVDETANEAAVFFDYHAADAPSLIGVYQLEKFHTADEIRQLSAGKAVVINNVSDNFRAAAAAAEFESLGVRALTNSPYVSDGRWKFTLSAQREHAHQWRADEIELSNELAARVYLRLERARAEAAVRESEAKYRTLFDSIDVGFCVIEMIFDAGGRAVDYSFLETNPAFEKQTGIKDGIGRKVSELIPDHEEFWFETYGSIAVDGVAARFEHPAAALNRWYDVYAFRVGAPDSRQVGVLFTDISLRKRSELNLAFLAEISQDLARLAAVDEIMRTVGAKIGAHLRLSMCNFIEINETADTAIIAYSWHDARMPSAVGVYRIADFVTDEFQRVSRAGEIFAVSDTRSDSRTNAENYAARQIGSLLSVPFIRDGEWRFLLVVYHSAAHDWRADEIELLRELTTRVWTRLERARAEEIIRESQKKLRTALEAGRMGSWELNLMTGVMTASDTCKTNYGRLPNDDFSYQDLAAAVVAEDRAVWQKTVDEAIEKCAEFEIAYRVRWLDNSIHWVLVRGNCFTDEAGKTNMLAGVSVDITRRKQIESEREKLLATEQELRQSAEDANRLKDEFLATLSHELRTPLNAILGWSQMLQNRSVGEDDRIKALMTIERNARAQSQLIDDILDVSRIITGKLRLDVRSVDLPSVITAAVEAALPAAEAKGIRLQSLLDPQAGPISGDSDRLQQIVWNLLSNAVKFTPKGGRVQVRLERVNSHVEIVISDTGKGIEAEFLPHVFDRFRQSDGSMTRRHGGLGLGLAIARQLVELHGGLVSVESAGSGQGATFTVNLPLLPVRRNHPDDASRVHPKVQTGALTDCPPELADLRILLIDDEADSRELLNLVLESCGAILTNAGSAAEAFEILRNGNFDVVVSDIGMPDEDGFSLIRRIRSLPNEQGGGVPAIALTAYARAEDRVQALRSGFQMHIAKPVEPDELIVAVANLAGRMRKPAAQ